MNDSHSFHKKTFISYTYSGDEVRIHGGGDEQSFLLGTAQKLQLKE